MSGWDPVEEAELESFPASDPPAYQRAPAPEAGLGLVWPFALPPLRFGYADLEPVVDAATLRVHHDVHHRAYVDSLNAALAGLPDRHGLTVEEILRRIDELPLSARDHVRAQAGGHANHQFLWKILAPPAERRPEGALADAIERDFGCFASFRHRFADAGNAHRGAGWIFLVSRPRRAHRLEILTLPNLESVLTLAEPAAGLLICDLWEHAFHRNRNGRAAWLEDWWRIVDWTAVGKRHAGATEGRAQL